MIRRTSIFSSIKTRVVVMTLALFVISIWVMTWLVGNMLQHDMQRTLGEQQFTVVSIAAAEIDSELGQRLDALQAATKPVADAVEIGPSAVQQVLRQRPFLRTLFNSGMGVYQADSLQSMFVSWVGSEDTDKSANAVFFDAIRRDGTARISTPYKSARTGHAMFEIAVPVRNAGGRLVAILLGRIDLARANFLDEYQNNSYGRAGTFLLVASTIRTVITASDPSRVMDQLPAPGVNVTVDRFIAGYEGSAVFTNDKNVEVLASSHNLARAPWQIVVSTPTAEAFAPLHAMQRHMVVITIVLTLMAGAVMGWMLRRQLAPLTQATALLSNLHAPDATAQLPAVHSNDEVGVLIHAFNRLLATLHNREAVLQTLLDHAPVGILLVRADGSVARANARAREIWGLDDADTRIAAGTLYLKHGGMTWADGTPVPQTQTPVAQVLQQGAAVTGVEIGLQQGDRVRWIMVDAVPSPDADYGAIVSCVDITERRALEQRIRHMAFLDPLTQLPNRRLLEDRLSLCMAASKRSGKYGALMVIDLDNFKPLNDLHGHIAGDLLLVEVANRLLYVVRQTDTVARYGGDEFVVMLSELSTSLPEARRLASDVAYKICKELAEPYRLTFDTAEAAPTPTVVDYQCSASIGVVLLVESDASQVETMARADAAMYQAKAAGRNQVRFGPAGNA